jgi:hypothetical protein
MLHHCQVLLFPLAGVQTNWKRRGADPEGRQDDSRAPQVDRGRRIAKRTKTSYHLRRTHCDRRDGTVQQLVVDHGRRAHVSYLQLEARAANAVDPGRDEEVPH